MHVCVVSFKECWPEQGQWMSSGGFPLQMAAVGSLFDRMTLVVVRGRRQSGGIPLPPEATVVALRPPRGADLRRKLSVAAGLPYYLGAISGMAVMMGGHTLMFLSMLAAMLWRRDEYSHGHHHHKTSTRTAPDLGGTT